MAIRESRNMLSMCVGCIGTRALLYNLSVEKLSTMPLNN
jgi:hypothetical protein